MCHYCDYEVPAPTTCPTCGFIGIRYSGLGTQRLEAEVRARFPNVLCLRMDTDTMQAHGSHERALSAFRSGKVRILLGTQMIAKGLDFPNVTLVGVINADTALHLPDFRAAERTFHWSRRWPAGPAAGRRAAACWCRRSAPIIRPFRRPCGTTTPRSPPASCPSARCSAIRRFASMIRLVIRGPVEPVAAEFAKYIAERLDAAIEAAAKPTPACSAPPRARSPGCGGSIASRFRCKAPTATSFARPSRQATADLEPPDDVQWIVDVDPVDML